MILAKNKNKEKKTKKKTLIFLLIKNISKFELY